VPGGVSVWHAGTSNETSYAERIDYPKNWDLQVLLVMASDTSAKKVGSTEGMALATTSPYFQIAVKEAELNIDRLRDAMKNDDFTAFGKVIEDECFRLHMLCMTTTPNILYWRGMTVEVFQTLLKLRESGIQAYFTVDAGPHVHVVVRKSDAEKVKTTLSDIAGVKTIIQCGIGEGTKLVDTHLF
jgi:diphosphomevalonate decarboxylase